MTDHDNEPWRRMTVSLTDFCKEFLSSSLQPWQLQLLEKFDEDPQLRVQERGWSNQGKAYLLAHDLFKGYTKSVRIAAPTTQEAKEFTALVRKYLKEMIDATSALDEPDSRPSDSPRPTTSPSRPETPNP